MSSLCDMTIADAIIACHIGRDFCWTDDIVDRNPLGCMWERDVDDLCSEFSKLLDRSTDSLLDSLLDTFYEILFRNSDTHSAEIFSFPDFWIESHRICERSRIMRIMSRSHFIKTSSITNSVSKVSRTVE